MHQGNDISNIINDPKMKDARDKLIELAKYANEQLKAEKQAMQIFQSTDDSQINKLLKDAKIKVQSYANLKKEIEDEECQTKVGKLKKFNITKAHVNLNLFILIIGKRRTGKTYMLNDLIFNYFKHIKYWLVLTNTEFNGFWTKRIPKKCVKPFDPDVITSLYQCQIKRATDFQNRNPHLKWEEVTTHPEIQTCLILDDVIDDKYTVRYHPDVVKLSTQGRHYGLTVFFISQYFYSVPPDCRGNADMVFVLNQIQENQIEGIAKNYLGFLSKQGATDLIKTVACEEHEHEEIQDEEYFQGNMFVRILVIHLWCNKSLLQDCLAWYSASNKQPEYQLMDDKYRVIKFNMNLDSTNDFAI